jgi:acyl carrier protein
MSLALRQMILDWLDDNYHFGDAAKLIKSDEMSFLQNGILDSLGFVQLILHIEKTCGVKFNRKDVTPKNFDGLGKIVAYVSAMPNFREPAR